MKIKILFIVFLISANHVHAENWQNLLDENLSHWNVYLSYRHQPGYDGSVPTDETGNPIKPIGLSDGPDKEGVFSVRMENGEPILHVTGEIYGAATSKKQYGNYHLSLQFRWGDKKWPPRENLLRDSGILYHGQGEHGVEYWRSWMMSQEFQIMRGHVGDYWSQASSAIDIRALIPEYIMNPIADENEPFLKVGKGESIQGFVLRSKNVENAMGEWNTLELITVNGKSLHIVNGEVVMVLQNSRYIAHGKPVPMESGYIQLQSEAAELDYRRIRLRKISNLPERFSHLY